MMRLRRNIPLLLAGTIVTLIVGLRLLSTALPARTGSVDPRITLLSNEAQQFAEQQRRQQVHAFRSVAEGEVSRTEERIREVTAVALAATLYAANEALAQRTPSTMNALLAGVNAAGLLPPGMDLDASTGVVRSVRGELQLRYRSEPLEIEVLSVGKERLDGPMLLLRVPQSSSQSKANADAAQLYIATRLDEIPFPRSFISEAEIITMGFAPEPFRALNLPNPETGK
ncbi:MAG TPA: hypothetical protein VJT15_24885 [Pyrinomonadaceae bacterium]|nr:hypothetical protein [Pyrinomonadaceae bacterium]